MSDEEEASRLLDDVISELERRSSLTEQEARQLKEARELKEDI